jgi:predicted GNAT superfamily acetyltransferase
MKGGDLRFITTRQETMRDSILRQVLDLNNANTPHVNELSWERFLHIVGQSALFAVIVTSGELGDLVVGFLICHTHGADYDSPNFVFFDQHFAEHHDFLYVDRLVVREDFQRQGLGRRLYELVDDLASTYDRPMRHLCCEVNVVPPNPESMTFHARCGFAPVGEQDTEGGTKRVSLLVRSIKHI